MSAWVLTRMPWVQQALRRRSSTHPQQSDGFQSLLWRSGEHVAISNLCPLHFKPYHSKHFPDIPSLPSDHLSNKRAVACRVGSTEWVDLGGDFACGGFGSVVCIFMDRVNEREC